MSPDELKAIPKGQFIVMKTGMHPMKVTLRLFLDWGIRFGELYEVPEQAQREVFYASRQELEKAILNANGSPEANHAPDEPLQKQIGVGMDKKIQAMANPKEDES